MSTAAYLIDVAIRLMCFFLFGVVLVVMCKKLFGRRKP